jgi:hypothetical protein
MPSAIPFFVAMFLMVLAYCSGVVSGPNILRRITGRKKTQRFVIKYDLHSAIKGHDPHMESGRQGTFHFGIWDRRNGKWYLTQRWLYKDGPKDEMKELNRLNSRDMIEE